DNEAPIRTHIELEQHERGTHNLRLEHRFAARLRTFSLRRSHFHPLLFTLYVEDLLAVAAHASLKASSPGDRDASYGRWKGCIAMSAAKRHPTAAYVIHLPAG